jgi:DNA-binding CsgD family transcriptional regulator
VSNTGLSERELEVLRLKAAGYSGNQIAHGLSISRQTVRHHISSILRKLEVCNAIAAVAVAARDGDIDLDSIEILRRDVADSIGYYKDPTVPICLNCHLPECDEHDPRCPLPSTHKRQPRGDAIGAQIAGRAVGCAVAAVRRGT